MAVKFKYTRNEITHLSANPLSSEDRFSSQLYLLGVVFQDMSELSILDYLNNIFSVYDRDGADAGHDVHVENRAVFVSLVKSFLLAERSF